MASDLVVSGFPGVWLEELKNWLAASSNTSAFLFCREPWAQLNISISIAIVVSHRAWALIKMLQNNNAAGKLSYLFLS